MAEVMQREMLEEHERLKQETRRLSRLQQQDIEPSGPRGDSALAERLQKEWEEENARLKAERYRLHRSEVNNGAGHRTHADPTQETIRRTTPNGFPEHGGPERRDPHRPRAPPNAPNIQSSASSSRSSSRDSTFSSTPSSVSTSSSADAAVAPRHAKPSRPPTTHHSVAHPSPPSRMPSDSQTPTRSRAPSDSQSRAPSMTANAAQSYAPAPSRYVNDFAAPSNSQAPIRGHPASQADIRGNPPASQVPIRGGHSASQATSRGGPSIPHIITRGGPSTSQVPIRGGPSTTTRSGPMNSHAPVPPSVDDDSWSLALQMSQEYDAEHRALLAEREALIAKETSGPSADADREAAARMQREFDEEDRRLSEALNDLRAQMPSEFSCMICMEELSIEDRAIVTPCDHTTCRDCMRGHLESTIRDSRYPIYCPICTDNKSGELTASHLSCMVLTVFCSHRRLYATSSRSL